MESVTDQFSVLKGRFDIDLLQKHHFGGGIYAKQMHVPKGYSVGKHAHNYDHLSILANGRVCIETDEDAKEYSAPVCILIKANLFHKITALDDSVWFCIHATEETDPGHVDQVLIEK